LIIAIINIIKAQVLIVKMTEQVGFVGLGAMGIGMTPLLQTYLNKQNEKPLIFTNRSMEKGNAIVEMGAKPATLEQLIEKCTIIFFMVSQIEREGRLCY
jgi:3-hydroxyisobutyrate dehydrogenase-like beta-hydroxyacid dehydrogenase